MASLLCYLSSTMFKSRYILLLAFPLGLFCIPLLLSFQAPEPAKSPAQLVKLQFEAQCDSFIQQASLLQKNIETFTTDSTQLKQVQARYLACRHWYKQLESLLEYYYPSTAKALNGALVNESDEEEGTQTVIEPEGMQIIEDIIFSDKPQAQHLALQTHSKRILAMGSRLRTLNAALAFGDFQIIDAQRMELIRIMALSITGFDAPASGNSIAEIRSNLQSIRSTLACYKPLFNAKKPALYKTLSRQLNAALLYLGLHQRLDHINRYTFTRDHLNPLYKSITQINAALGIPVLQIPSPIAVSAASIFSNEAINTNYYNPNNTAVDNNVIALGRLLFFDPVLSGNQQRACASCHNPQLAFTDNKPQSLAFGAEGVVSRNAPSIINVGFQAAYFYDSRANYLEEQARAVAHNQQELHGDLNRSAEILKQSAEYRQLFRQAFNGKSDTTISLQSIIKSLAAYERSLVAMNSKFDRNIRGDAHNFSKAEINGFNLFMGKAQCGTCHFMPMLGGTVPPAYTKTEWEILGVPSKADTAHAELDKDLGRYAVNGMELNKYAFKTSSLRNVALTAPYMHNGAYKTLEEVIDFYNRGGGYGIGIRLDTQTLPTDELKLDAAEKNDLLAFLKTLTDTSRCTTIPTRLPAFGDSKLDSRKIGGEY